MSEERADALTRSLGVPGILAAAYSGVGFSIYFALGVVAGRGLGLTPVIFLVAGLLFGLTTLSYMEGNSMFPERGGSAAISRHAFNELVSFIAGWAILIDLLIIVALAAISVPHYMTPLGAAFGEAPTEMIVAAVVIGLTVGLNAAGIAGPRLQRWLALGVVIDVGFLLAITVIGAVVVMDPDALTRELDLFGTPSLEAVIEATVLATIAYAAIEAAANLAPESRWSRRALRRTIAVAAVTVPVLYAGIAAVALMAVPVEPSTAKTELGDAFVEAPILGVVQSFDPLWLADGLRFAVMVVASAVLVWAAYTAMLGISRVSYTLATNRQIPSWVGRLGKRTATPFIVIAIAGAIAMGLALPADVELLAGLYAFGAMMSFTIAHLSVLRLRVTQPDRRRPFRIPLNVRLGGHELPVSAIAGAVLGVLGWGSVVAFMPGARWVGAGWMAFGLIAYVGYRLYEGVPILKRIEVSAEALKKERREISYRRILVPVFASDLDDDIVGTAGRFGAAVAEDSADAVELRLIYVFEVPVKVPLHAKLDRALEVTANDALARAVELADEYEGVNVHGETLRARAVGSGIVEDAEEWGAEVIVMGAEPPVEIQYVSSFRPPEIGKATEYVLEKARCRVMLTAPPARTAEPERQ